MGSSSSILNSRREDDFPLDALELPKSKYTSLHMDAYFRGKRMIFSFIPLTRQRILFSLSDLVQEIFVLETTVLDVVFGVCILFFLILKF